MIRQWHPLHAWECQAMYRPCGVELQEGKRRYAAFLADLEAFHAATQRVFREWPTACEHFLTDSAMNRVAWIGQASACLAIGLSRHYRGGFLLLTQLQQRAANRTAWDNLKRWEASYAQQNRPVHSPMAQTRLWA